MNMGGMDMTPLRIDSKAVSASESSPASATSWESDKRRRPTRQKDQCGPL
jgi:hypothetical protein